MERVVYCSCGGRMRAPEDALGMQGLCVRCGTAIIVGEQNSFPLMDDSSQLPPLAALKKRPVAAPPHMDARYAQDAGAALGQTAHPGRVAGAYACVRCGRTFRGAWDRNKTPEGEICHICARRIRPEDGNAAPSAPDPAPPPAIWDFANPQDKQVMAPKVVHRNAFSRITDALRLAWDDWRVGGAILAVTAIIVIGLLQQFPVAEHVADFFTVEIDEENPQVSPILEGLFITLMFLRPLVQYFVMLYILLAWCRALPNDTFFKNLIALGWVAVILAVIGAYVGMLPVMGGILAFALQIYFILNLYDLNFEQTLRLIPCYFIAWLLTKSVYIMAMSVFAALAV